MKKLSLLLLCLWLLDGPSGYCGTRGIIDTKHNLSSSGVGEIRALTEDRICIFCHTPHNARPSTPLWNHAVNEGVNYDTYESSSTVNLNISQPTGPSRLCLSCHDGTVALGAVNSVSGGVSMTMELVGRPSQLGTDLRDDHPFSFSYAEAKLYDPELQATLPPEIPAYNNNMIHCTSCHDPHDDKYGMFLVVDNRYSGLCVKCHNLNGWTSSSHATDTSGWSGIGNDPWPLNSRVSLANSRNTVAENGCENCHTPHNAGGPRRLLNFREEEKNCLFACHNTDGPGADIATVTQQVSSHPFSMAAIGDVAGTPHDPAEDVSFLAGHVECQDCHNAHSVRRGSVVAPNVSGLLARVKGISQNGLVVDPAVYEYEICFKCHGDSNSDTSSVNRYSNEKNKRLSFSTSNPSFHPVVGLGKNYNVPSIPSQVSIDPAMKESTVIYCTDCHDSDATSRIGGNGPVGPHGSIYSPILRERYETALSTVESYAVYALCYRCHDRNSILSDTSFRKKAVANRGGHSGHLASGGGTTCSVCHDPHGVVDNGISGDHTNLINFDTTVVTPAAGQNFPLFTDNGLYSGACTLVCHGVTHTGYAYP